MCNLKNVWSEIFIETSCNKRLLSPKKYYAQPPWMRKLIDWNSGSPVFLKKNHTDFLKNEGSSCRFEKFNGKLRINFFKNIAAENSCKFSIISLHKKSQIKNVFSLTHQMPVLLSYRNQSIDLQSKSIDWFLYERAIGS